MHRKSMTEKVEKTLVEAVVVFPEREDGAKLFARKTMKIGEGCWNGYGGGLEAEETPEAAAVRELEEESELVAEEKNLEKIGILKAYSHKSDGRVVQADVHFYIARRCKGEPKEKPDMITPTWFLPHEIPWDELMPADKLWLPRVFAGERLVVTVHYGPFQKELLEPIHIEVVERFNENGEPVRHIESETKHPLK